MRKIVAVRARSLSWLYTKIQYVYEQCIPPYPRTSCQLVKTNCKDQRWSPRGHILKSLTLASKLKSVASSPTSPPKCPVLGSRTALFFDWLKRKITKYKNFLISEVGVAKNFDCGGWAIRKSHAIWRHHQFSKGGTFYGRNLEWKEGQKPWS